MPLALVHAGLGDADAAFAWMDRAYAARDVHLMFLTVDVKWDRCRSDPDSQICSHAAAFLPMGTRPGTGIER